MAAPAGRAPSGIGLLLALALQACAGGGACGGGAAAGDAGADADRDVLGPVDWVIDLDPATSAPVSRALLGQYDLSGALFDYDQVAGLAAALEPVGFAEWRVGVGRWELATRLLPTLTNGTACHFPLPEAFAPAGADDLALITERDWFTDDGQAATLATTADDARYALGYVRHTIDVATALGARAYLSVDLMPRALAANRTPERSTAIVPDACNASFTNRVSNAAPAAPEVFAAAVTGLVQRLVEGSGGEPGRAVQHVEVWNEPELPYFWDGALDPERTRFFEAAGQALVRLDAYRAASSRPEVQALRFGFGSFASSATAAAVIEQLDANPIPGYGRIPLDFVSFHAYHNDPLVVVGAVEEVAAARAASTGYGDVELVLAEWGPDLGATAGDVAYAWSNEPLLHAATVLVLGAYAGLGRAHHSIFWDYYRWNAITWGLFDHELQAKPLAFAYQLLARAIPEMAVRLRPRSPADGRLDEGAGAVLVTRDAGGTVRALFVNRGEEWRTARLLVDGVPARPGAVTAYFLPDGLVAGQPDPEILVPPRALLLVEVP